MKKAIALAAVLLIVFIAPFALAEGVAFPSNLKIIEKQAFCGNTLCERLDLPEGVEQIRSQAFAYSGASKVYLPASLSFIAPDAFEGCSETVFVVRPDTLAHEWCIMQGVSHILLGEDGSETHVPPADEKLDFVLHPAEKEDWYAGDVQRLIPVGSTFSIYDIHTGLVWQAQRGNGSSHAEIEPLTAADTKRLCRIYGVKDAQEIAEQNLHQRRPCLVTVDNRTFACSLYGVPHNAPGDTIADNGVDGVLCLFFTSSTGHTNGTVDETHEAAIEYAYLNAPNGQKSDFTWEVNEFGEGLILTRYTGHERQLRIPQAVDDLPVVAIAGEAFAGCTDLVSVQIPASIETIDAYRLFDGCISLTEIQVDENNPCYTSEDGVLFSKGKTTLIACPPGMTGNYTAPETVRQIGSYAFADSALSSIVLQDGVLGIGDSAFSSCTHLTSIVLPPSILHIGPLAFVDSEALVASVWDGSYAHRWCLAEGIDVEIDGFVGGYAVVLQDGVVLRAGASTDSAIRDRAGIGTVLRWYDLQNVWYQVDRDGQICYIMASFVMETPAPVGYVKTTASGVRVRKTPTGSSYYSQIAEAGTVLTCFGAEESGGYTWYCIFCDGNLGYIRGDVAQPCDSEGNAAELAAATENKVPLSIGLCRGRGALICVFVTPDVRQDTVCSG